MLGRIISIVGESDVVALARSRRVVSEPQSESDAFRFEIEFLNVLRGTIDGAASHILMVRLVGRDTPLLSPDSVYLVFLESLEPSQPASREWGLVEMSAPILVHGEQRATYISNMNEYVALEAEKSDTQRLKDHLLRMLNSRIGFFERDAGLEARDIEDWSPDEIDQLIAIARRDDERGPLAGLAREKVTIVIIRNGNRQQVLPYVREELLAGNTSDAFWGFTTIEPAGADSIVLEFLADADVRVRTEAIRLAGLLRRGSILDAVEEQTKIGPDDDETKARLLRAIDEARALVDRD
ncbi:MAG: hypothetical protein KAW46_01010 [candidate division Zixibacteria bacterium]|nr:hypothetical protein [candidate division Zixibacteria bacterium]